jgi:hypothetical protein
MDHEYKLTLFERLTASGGLEIDVGSFISTFGNYVSKEKMSTEKFPG